MFTNESAVLLIIVLKGNASATVFTDLSISTAKVTSGPLLYQNDIFESKYAFDSIFQALQDLHPFAPLQSQTFRKKSV